MKSKEDKMKIEFETPKEKEVSLFNRIYFIVGKFDCWIPEIGKNPVELIYIDWLFFHFVVYRKKY